MKVNSIISSVATQSKMLTKNNVVQKKLDYNNSIQTNGMDCVSNLNRANINFGLKLNTDDYDLSRLKLSPNFRVMPHNIFLYARPLGHPRTYIEGSWKYFNSTQQTHCPWKMHIYSDTESEYQKLCTLLGPYLKKNDISWKTYAHGNSIEELNNGLQKGKAITIYPHSCDEFSRLAEDIDFIVKNNNLCRDDSEIFGDRKLGDSGRIFYRYEYKSKEFADTLLDVDNDDEYKMYRAIYEPARANGSYLASDMTSEDDPWFDFNPDVRTVNVGE